MATNSPTALDLAAVGKREGDSHHRCLIYSPPRRRLGSSPGCELVSGPDYGSGERSEARDSEGCSLGWSAAADQTPDRQRAVGIPLLGLVVIQVALHAGGPSAARGSMTLA